MCLELWCLGVAVGCFGIYVGLIFMLWGFELRKVLKVRWCFCGSLRSFRWVGGVWVVCLPATISSCSCFFPNVLSLVYCGVWGVKQLECVTVHVYDATLGCGCVVLEVLGPVSNASSGGVLGSGVWVEVANVCGGMPLW